jgi:hypothetical protein
MGRQGWIAGALAAFVLGLFAPSALAGTPATGTFDSITGVGVTVATFNGHINGHQDVHTLEYRWEWCKVADCADPAALQTTAWDSAPNTFDPEVDQPVSTTIRDLSPATAYRVWLRSYNDSSGIEANAFRSAPREFTTQSPVANVTASARTDAAGGVGESTANLNGTAVPGTTGGSGASQWWFEWGEGSTPNQSTPATTIAAGTDAVPVSAPLSGLKALTTYSYKLVVLRGGVRYEGAAQSFGTLSGFNCVTGTTFRTATIGRLLLTGCIRTSGSRTIAVGAARLNGLTFTPAGGSEVYVDRGAAQVGTTGRYALSAGSVKNLWAGTLKVTGVQFDGDEPLMSLGADRSVDLLGLPLAGDFTFTPKPDGSGRLGLLVGMPVALGGVTGETVAAVDPSGSLVLDKLAVDVGSATIKSFEVGDLHFLYDRSDNRWEGGASIVVPFQGRIRVGVTIAVVDGRFSEFTGSVGDLNKHIADGVFLQDIGLGFGLDPLKLAGSMGLTAGPRIGGLSAIGVNGGWEFRDAYSDFNSATRIATSYPPNLRLTGTVTVFTLPLAEMHAAWYFTGYPWIDLGGTVGVDFKSGSTSLATVQAAVNGKLQNTYFQLDGSAVGKLGGYTLASGYAALNGKGVSACGSVLGQGAGAYMTWSNWNGGVYWSCDYGSLMSHISAAAAAAGTGVVRLPPGASHAQVRFVGAGGPPEVSLTGPGGRVVSMPPAGQLVGGVQDQYLVVRDPGTHSTYVQLTGTGSGAWKWTAAAGSTVRSVQTARWLGAPRVRATVRSVRGRRAVLRWHLRPVPGQVVTFTETGDGVPPRVIARTRAAAGSRRFTPAEVPATRHRIVAIVEQDGRPRRTLDVARFRTAKPRKLAKPRRVAAIRRGSRLQVTFSLAAPARRAQVLVRYPDGRRVLRFPAGRRMTLKGAAARARAVTVQAIGADGSRGPGASAKVKVAKRTR